MRALLPITIRLSIVVLSIGIAGCASAPKDRAQDAQCGKFCDDLSRCLGNEYDDDLKERLCEMARCESGCRARIKSPAGYVGAFQFAKRTWTGVCGPIFARKGLNRCRPVESRNDLCCAAACTAEMVARGDGGHWPNCGR
jgi:hypothetical protein